MVDEATQSPLIQFMNSFRFEIDADHVSPCPPLPVVKADPQSVPAAVDGPGVNSPASPMAGAAVAGGGVANKTVLNKSSLNKNKNKNKNKASFGGISTGDSQLIPAFQLRRLHQQPSRNAFTAAARFTWEMLDITPPPGPDFTRLETKVLLSMQKRDRERARRLPDIQQEASLSVTEFTRPLYIENIAGFEQTEGLFQNILTACEYVGLIYKSKFNRIRPHQFEPRLRPLLAVPATESYQSNHAFQCFSVAFAFNTILPEHPATEQLARIAQNVAENREWAGLHYPSDTKGGRELARRFAPYLRDAFATTYNAVHKEWV
ncbi:phosphatase PAP2 family protein [Phyllobacterium zundukense]|uniref:Phospholipid phosphatase n=1 Tax=Phyllobacterium zundukense TaxID=1867719 RepID=A0A2N9VPA7_9HYPH|nr:phospholipid phosphatase [Phyllobacterium zundukense]ATU94877.1 phospholipid phosphatase [Phyllobacterium zundukense]PIO41325.1 phospholipid phosphatase [Phyllobacterium zundukense]